jgi:hypothetical protein
MSIENAVVIGEDGNPIHWHTPPGRSAGSIPDSADLWDILWENRDHLAGVAHSHPGRGIPGPSYEDVTTFAAVEAALGRKLRWWITSENELVVATRRGLNRAGSSIYDTERVEPFKAPWWCDRLRRMSYEPAKFEALEPALPCSCNNKWGTYPKAAWEEDSYALIAFGTEGGIILEHEGPHIDFELQEAGTGPFVEDMGLTPPHEDPGLWIWKGRIVDTTFHGPDGTEYDYELDGEFRELTDEEWKAFRAGESILPQSQHVPCYEQACEERQRLEALEETENA